MNETSGLYKGISALGNAIALAAMILGTPLVFSVTKRPLYAYFMDTWGPDFAVYLVWLMGGIEGFIIFSTTALLFKSGVVWTLTSLAMRRFRE